MPEPGQVDLPSLPDDAELARIIQGLPGYNPCDLADGFHFEADLARKALRFFHEELRHAKGSAARKPFLLERWQQAIVGNLFGWIDDEGLRRYRQAFIYVPRKNGKTPMAAGMILYLLFEDDEPGPEIYGCAREYQQASLVWHHARSMVAQNPRLANRCQVFRGGQARCIETEDRGLIGTYRVVPADPDSAQGWNAHAGVIDEVHTLPDAGMIDALDTATAHRRQPLLLYITTADYERPGSPCNELHEYAKGVRDGAITDARFLPAIWEAARDCDWKNPQVWAAANPNLGVSVGQEYLERACQKAQDMPRFENTFKRLHLNIRTEQAVRWLPMDQWDQCRGNVDAKSLAARICYAGLDLAAKVDMTSLVLVFPPEGDEPWRIMPFYFVPEEIAQERDRKNQPMYMEWIREGYLTATPGNVTDYSYVRQKLLDLSSKYAVQEVAFDPWNALAFATQLKEEDGFQMIEFRQGYKSMSEPAKELEKLIISIAIAHGGHPVLRWNAANVAIQEDPAGNIKPAKDKSTGKIDGIVATIMALGRAMLRTDASSCYEDRGLRFI